jgi:regulator of sigma E protease
MVVLYILLAIVILLLMIMIHETGHYVAGKILKFKIEEFSIGFGPKIFSKKMKSGEVFSLRWIPLGGFCAFKGEDEDEEDEENIDQEGTFNSYACWKRLIVLFCGAFFNFVSGILFVLILLTSVGSGVVRVTDVVAENSNKDVLFKNDIILEVDGKEPTFINGGIVALMSDKDVGEDIVLTVDRNGEILDVKVQKYQIYQEDEEGNTVYDEATGNPIVAGSIIGVTSEYVRLSFGESLVKCVPYTFNMAWECLAVLGKLFTGQIGLESVGGPITTVQTIVVSTQTNIKNLVLLFPLLAVNLAVFNLLPIPALDGARMIFVLIEWIFRKPVPRELEAKIHSVGLIALFALVIVIDLLHIFLF